MKPILEKQGEIIKKQQLKINPETRKNNFYLGISAFMFDYEKYLKLINTYGEIFDPNEMQGLNFMHKLIDDEIMQIRQDFSDKNRLEHLKSGILGIQKILERKIPPDSDFYKNNITSCKN